MRACTNTALLTLRSATPDGCVSTIPNAYAHRRYSSPVPTANPATETRDYEAHHLLVLEGLEAVRKRPAMYIGSTDTRGLMHCLWEIIDNAVDEALGGFGKEISVTL